MGDKYQKNYSGSDFKRNTLQEQNESEQDEGEERVKLNEKAGEYMRELLSEKIKMDQSKFPLLTNLVDQEVTRVQATGRIPLRDQKYVDVYREKSIKVVAKVLVPIKEHPKFNFVGKLLGPKGNTLKQLQEDTMCKMAVLGRGSMRDRQKEEEFRNSLDPKYAHLSDELHVEIAALGPPAEAHARMAYALAEIRKYLVPDSNDFIRQNQMREIIDRRPRAPPPPPHRAPSLTPRVMPAKAKVISILDRARSAMEESYGYEEPYDVREPPVRGIPHAPETDYYGYDRSERYYEEEPVVTSVTSGRGGEYKAAGHARSLERAPRTTAGHGGGLQEALTLKPLGSAATNTMNRINDNGNVVGTIIVNCEGFPETTTLDSLTAATYSNHMRSLCRYAANAVKEVDVTDEMLALRMISKKTEAVVVPDEEFHIIAVVRRKNYA